ncbi:hypothetical protein LPB67_14270 [Undibacterium sp. Jales W-56]|uniref:hypothetical protein n=1 Tax=Undibacterium sp. Jales W-56 TaxID=2897325 RepID=UPI0021D277AE|nr:hypothetical protein [Undibacterium sp. Jales W-56]MCU6434939.1 hypothetical protein [Undibacterium sp. Jales W-56]
MKRLCALSLLLLSSLGLAQSSTDVLNAKFSCNLVRQEGGDGERLNYADQGVIQLRGNVIKNLQWESSLFRSTNGHECSIDSSDEPQAELTPKGWRISLKNAAEARSRRGYDFERGLNCSIRLERSGDELAIRPSCPALCGSRLNFTTLTVNLKNGQCQYDE